MLVRFKPEGENRRQVRSMRRRPARTPTSKLLMALVFATLAVGPLFMEATSAMPFDWVAIVLNRKR